MKLSERLIGLRKEKNLSQEELAAVLNVSRQAVSRWETGLAAPSLDKLQFLAEFYGITIDELFYSVEEKPKAQEQAPKTQATENKSNRKLFWLCTAAVVIVLLAGVLIAAIDHKAHNENIKEPTPIGELEGIVIEMDRTQDIELIPVE